MTDTEAEKEHIRTHAGGYPTSRQALIQACNNMSDFSEEDKKEFAEKLPDRTYNSPEEVFAALGI